MYRKRIHCSSCSLASTQLLIKCFSVGNLSFVWQDLNTSLLIIKGTLWSFWSLGALCSRVFTSGSPFCSRARARGHTSVNTQMTRFTFRKTPQGTFNLTVSYLTLWVCDVLKHIIEQLRDFEGSAPFDTRESEQISAVQQMLFQIYLEVAICWQSVQACVVSISFYG